MQSSWWESLSLEQVLRVWVRKRSISEFSSFHMPSLLVTILTLFIEDNIPRLRKQINANMYYAKQIPLTRISFQVDHKIISSMEEHIRDVTILSMIWVFCVFLWQFLQPSTLLPFPNLRGLSDTDSLSLSLSLSLSPQPPSPNSANAVNSLNL